MSVDGNPYLRLTELTVDFASQEGTVHAVNHVGFEVAPRELVGMAGERSCGKGVTASAIIGLSGTLPDATVSSSIEFDGRGQLTLLRPGSANPQPRHRDELSGPGHRSEPGAQRRGPDDRGPGAASLPQPRRPPREAQLTRRSHKASAVTAAFLLGFALLLALGLAACGVGTAEDASTPLVLRHTQAGRDAHTLSYLTEPSSLDPAVAWNLIDWQIEHDIYQGFLQYAHEPGAAGTELVPCLATEVPSTANGGISADGKVYTFKLREGVRFQPPVSREVIASDFKYSFERMMKEPPRAGDVLLHGRRRQPAPS